ncbi:MAG: hypothetical protein OEZ06_04905 [Myxococcales bacterium]|nr:hypothetical protein [Myxococcales bacterium]
MGRVGLLWLCGFAVGCAGSSWNGSIYDDGVVRYRVGERASGFERVEVEDNDLAFHDRRLGTISVNSTCSEYEDVPPQALLNHLLFGMEERNFRLEEEVTLDGRGAAHAIVDVSLDGVPISLEIYMLRKDGCVYDLTLTSARSRFAEARRAFATFVRGFSVLETRL